jgi:hypothetical protein
MMKRIRSTTTVIMTKDTKIMGHMISLPIMNKSIGVASPRRNANGRLWMIIGGR